MQLLDTPTTVSAAAIRNLAAGTMPLKFSGPVWRLSEQGDPQPKLAHFFTKWHCIHSHFPPNHSCIARVILHRAKIGEKSGGGLRDPKGLKTHSNHRARLQEGNSVLHL